MAITGTCDVCGKESKWENVKSFSSSFLACKNCSQRYNLVLPDEFRANIDKNISKLLEKYGKLATWGINYHTADLFKKSKTLKGENIFPIEISELKRGLSKSKLTEAKAKELADEVSLSIAKRLLRK